MSNRKTLERAVKAFVARGSGIPQSKVIGGQTDTSAPDGLYASVTLRNQVPTGRVGYKQVVGDVESFTITDQLLTSMFDIQFYREGAVDAADRFAMYCRSESGVTWAATSLSCGRLAGVNVYEGGSGYRTGELFECPHDGDDEPGELATGDLKANPITGTITSMLLNSGGSFYSTMPRVLIPNTSGSGAKAAPRGYGFAVERVKVRNLSELESDNWEERAQIDLDLSHVRVYTDRDSGRVEIILGDSSFGDIRSEDMGGLNYIYQKNLYPTGDGVNESSVTKNTEDHAGIELARVSDWFYSDFITTDATTGLVEVPLLQEAAIAPDFGRDIIARSPFITAYEGTVLLTTVSPISDTVLGTSGENAIVYIKTTHVIAGMPTNIVSVRAFLNPITRVSSGGSSTFTISIDLSRFNSMVMLSNDQPSGGQIGLTLAFGVGLLTNRTNVDAFFAVSEMNSAQTINAARTPAPGIQMAARGNNTRVTFLQHTLAT